MTPAAFISLAATVLSQIHHEPEVTPEVLAGFAYKESSYREQVFGDHGNAWGLFQFHCERWTELGGHMDDYGNAPAELQIQIMVKELNQAARRAQARQLDFLTLACKRHNGGNFGAIIPASYYVGVKSGILGAKKST